MGGRRLVCVGGGGRGAGVVVVVQLLGEWVAGGGGAGGRGLCGGGGGGGGGVAAVGRSGVRVFVWGVFFLGRGGQQQHQHLPVPLQWTHCPPCCWCAPPNAPCAYTLTYTLTPLCNPPSPSPPSPTPTHPHTHPAQYLDGPEVDCDLVFSEGVCVFGAITDNWPTVEPYFNETGSNCPSILPRMLRGLC